MTEQAMDGRQRADVPEMVVLRPRLSERVWGFEKLPDFLEQPKPGRPVGEAWLTAMECVDEHSGLTLAELVRRWPEEFNAADGEFPLLMKWLFPREKLSVQVHPNDEQARAVGEPRGKTECWYVLSAEPGATVSVGFKDEAISREEIASAIAEGTLESNMRYLPVKAGDMVYLEAGTVHAMNPGVVVLETQQYSDTTYRLYDYGRPRELHLERGLAAINLESRSGLMTPEEKGGFVRLASSPYFVVDRFQIAAGESAALGLPSRMQILVALRDGAAVRLDSGAVRELPAGFGVVLPAGGTHRCMLQATRDTEVIRVSVP